MAAYGNMDRAVAGLTQGVNVFTHSRIAAETIKYGCAVFAEKGSEELVHSTKKTAANAVARVVSVTPSVTTAAVGTTGVSIRGAAVTVATTAESTGATVIAALVTAVNAASTGFTASNGTTKLVLTSDAPGSDSTEIAFIAGGGFTGVVADTTVGSEDVPETVLLGVARYLDKGDDSGVVGGYAATDTVPVVRNGLVFVPISGSVQANTTAYWDNTNKVFTADSGDLATGYTFRSNGENGLALVELI